MIRPALHALTIHPGAVFSRTLRATSGGTALDLTAYAPFTMEIRRTAGGELLATVAVDNDEVADGLLTLALTAAESALLEEGQANHDILDNTGNPWVYGPVKIRKTITEPPAP